MHSHVRVSCPPTPVYNSSTRPSHWNSTNPAAGFHNPWPSFRDNGFFDVVSMLQNQLRNAPPIPQNTVPVRRPTWGEGEKINSTFAGKATWLGHACFFVEMKNGSRVLFDPVFNDRCSPSHIVGPLRFTDTPCTVGEIPPIDAVVISHNHYDHMDTTTLKELSKRTPQPHFFAPLGNENYFSSLGISKSHFHTLDWWQHADVVSSDESSSGAHSFRLTCTPAQHTSKRGIFDKNQTLWSSWVLSTTDPDKEKSANVYFAGDTGYRTVQPHQSEDDVPTCPAFREIGEHFPTGFDFAMLPIGAYAPRWFMSSLHCAPQDSVRIFNDIGARKAVGMHWGTWALTTEDVDEPPRRLKEECDKIGIRQWLFEVCDIGETLLF